LRITGTLVAEGPLHVGGLGASADTDLALAEDGQGRLYVPGTSLAGALREWMERRHAAAAQRLWGFQQDPARVPAGEKPGGHASRVYVEDGLVSLPVGAVWEIREGVGIDRRWGTAADRIKHDRAVVPRGTTVALEASVEFVGPDDAAEGRATRAALVDLLEALTRGDVSLGAGKSRGLGRVRLDRLDVREEDLASPLGVLAALRAKAPARTLDELRGSGPTVERRACPRLDLRVHWRPSGPVMVKAERDGLAVDALPLVTASGDALTFVLPGSGLKGVLRAHAERIVRTVASDRPTFGEFLRQVEVPLVTSVFGTAGKAAKRGTARAPRAEGRDRDAGDATDDGSVRSEPQPGLAALAVEDCHASVRFTSRLWNAVERAGDEGKLLAALDALGLKGARLDHAFHVAVDRWTGGAAESLLFSVLEPHGLSWEPMRLRLDLTRLVAREREPALALVLLVLRDLGRGRLPIGHAGNRGMGAVEVRELEGDGVDLDAEWATLRQFRLERADPGGLPADLRARLDQAWQRWVAALGTGETP
jgi:CRISPR/Cas system CSM-associated protein Csm3 (group 7 of RAMP superfamily)